MNSQQTPHRTALVLLPLAVLALAQGRLVAAQSGDFSYTHSGGKATITGYTGSGGPVYIPSSLGGYPVIGIGAMAFQGINSITSLIVSNGPTSIGDDAFSNCSGLTDVVLPASVASLGGLAFGGCYSMSGLTLGSGLATIGDEAFYGCSALTNLALPASVTSIGDMAFDGTSITNLVIPGGVASLGTNAFGGCSLLVSVTVALGNGAYASESGVLFDKAISTLILYPPARPGASYAAPAGVKDIFFDAFDSATNLVSVTLPDSLTNIEDEAFYGCASLAGINIPGQVAAIGIDVFQGTVITNLIIPDSVVSIGNDLCPGSDSLTNVVIGSGLGTISDSAFYACTSLASVSLSDGLTNIADSAFYECPLASLTIPGSVLSIGDSAFVGSDLVSVSLPDSVRSVGSDAFASDSLLSSVSIGSGLTNLGSYAFSSPGMSNISVSAANPRFLSPGGVLIDNAQEVLVQYPAMRPGATYTVPAGITGLAGSSFSWAGNLASVTLPASVTSIGEYAFWGCWSLTNVTVLGNLTNVGTYAFMLCTNVTGFYFAGDAPSGVGTGAFDTGSGFTVYYVPSTLGWTQFLALNGLTGATWAPSGQAPLVSGVGLENKMFGFTVAVAPNTTVVVEACTNLSSPVWTALATNAPASGSFYFSDPGWTSHRGKFYRATLP